MVEAVKLLGSSKAIGPRHPCFFIAEAGVNHNGDMDRARALIDAAVAADADAVKFQSFRAEATVTAAAPRAGYQVETIGAGDQFSMLRALELSFPQQTALKEYCDARGIMFLSTPYDELSAEFLAGLGVAALKIASTDTTNVAFLRRVSTLGRPLLLSTGMCSLGEVAQAVEAAAASPGLVLLHCVSSYPAMEEEANLRAIRRMQDSFDCPVGYSDHITGNDVALWAVAAGAACIEKHFTLDRSLPGPDHRASMEPDEMTALIAQLRRLERALGDGNKRVMPGERANKPVMQKSLVAIRAIEIGSTLDPADLQTLRPATGIPANEIDRVVGKRLRRALTAGQIITYNDIDW